MARKRGRPPKSPGPYEIAHTDSQKHGLDLSELDEVDLADIDSLSPKQAEKLMKNLDLIREKLKGKATVTKISDESEKQTGGSQPVLREEEANPRAGTIPEENRAGALEMVQGLDQLMVSSEPKAQNPGTQALSTRSEKEGGSLDNEEGQWTTVATRCKAKRMNGIQKGESSTLHLNG
ncbi:hypothetical protein RIF29_19933 [Crotalaria pallida]|uniref:Uncharacterized protein n=1 Tax=Crotalaria pallida TaxID=3830 RepID=A0AAN9IBW1_CROPI